MNSMLSLFECIPHSLSLSIEELKLFAIVIVISITVTFVFNIIVTSKITYTLTGL